MVGYRWGYPAPIKTITGNLNVSAFTFSYSNLALLNEISGYRFERPSPLEQKQAECYCDQLDQPWPGPVSVKVEGPLAIVCIQGNAGPDVKRLEQTAAKRSSAEPEH